MTKDLVKKVFLKKNKYGLPIAATFIKLIEVDEAKGKYKTEFTFLTYEQLSTFYINLIFIHFYIR